MYALGRPLSSLSVAIPLTVTAQVADTSPEVAVMVAVPLDTPVTNPLEDTVATEVSEDDHVTVPPAGVVVAVSWEVVAPLMLMLD